jgi:hypothetical protein
LVLEIDHDPQSLIDYFNLDTLLPESRRLKDIDYPSRSSAFLSLASTSKELTHTAQSKQEAAQFNSVLISWSPLLNALQDGNLATRLSQRFLLNPETASKMAMSSCSPLKELQ